VTRLLRWRSGLHQAYVALVFGLGVMALLDSVWALQRQDLASHPAQLAQLVGLALLTIFSGIFAVKVPSLSATLSISETFLFIMVLFFGSAPSVVTVAVDGLMVSLVRRRRALRHVAFNLGEPALSMWIASRVYAALAHVDPLSVSPATMTQIGVPALALCAVYFVMNSGLNALAVATDTGSSPFTIWRKYFLWVSLNYFGGASIAVLLAVNTRADGVFTSILAIAPLVIVSYFTFKSSMGRLEDENRHLGDVNRLYLKVVETLAMAVDAKDQVTHGHIRRVQTYALQLARSLGVADEQELRAIEAAALLHDVGKLAIPEHILNKPGKLTPGEYERMKLHAPLGADMLSAVDFPYPVVPIVRHHHENWDGSGYPDGVAGSSIPIGARVLSVVDCYDALRSHRPYRRALSPQQALDIIRERRGTMYDPSVVDAFEEIQSAIEAESVDEPLPEVLDKFTQVAREMRRMDPVADAVPLELRVSSTDMLLQLYSQLSTLGPDANISQTCDIVSRSLLRLAPAGLVIFFHRDDKVDEVRAVFASGFGEALVRDIAMPMGHGVSGWVAANGRSVINADSALDLEQRLENLDPKFRSVLSVPLMVQLDTVGVVTLYSSQANAFREEQRQAIELISGPVAEVFQRAIQSRAANAQAALEAPNASVPNGQALRALVERDSVLAGALGASLGVLCVKSTGDADVMAHAAMAVSHATRIADLIFRPSPDSLVVLMPDCDAGAGSQIVDRIASTLPSDVVPPPLAGSPLRIAFACSPHDGETLRRLLETAQSRLDAQVPAEAELEVAGVGAGRGEGGQPWRT
jgi:putative nucleotidyltransferase with HDIG domain